MRQLQLLTKQAVFVVVVVVVVTVFESFELL